jgi:hypothetical protein
MDPDGAVARGRRRAQRRTAVLSASAAVAVVAAVAGVVQLNNETPPRTVQLGAPAQAEPERQWGVLQRTVRAHTPAGWTFAEPDEHASGFSADVDDGEGASRFYVGVSKPSGSLQQHPCSDHEFALDGACRESELGEGRRLITRGPTSSGPVTSSVVVIVHRDGSGVDVGNDNATWLRPPDGVLTPETKLLYSRPSVNRKLPVYSIAQLVEIAQAVDAATS